MLHNLKSSSGLALTLLLLGVFAIGFSPVFVRISELGPMATAVYRVALALPVLALWWRAERRLAPEPRAPITARDAAWMALAGVFFAGDLAFWHLAIAHTSIANATLFASTTPIFVAIAARFVFRETIGRRFVIALAATLAGGALVAGASAEIGTDHLLGDAFGVVTALFFSAYFVTVKRLRARCSAAAIMTGSGLVTVPVLLVVTVAAGEPLVAGTVNGWLVLLGLAWLCHAGGQGLLAQALARLPAAFSSLAMLSEAVFAAVIAWLLLGEALTPLQITGGVLVLAGILLARERRPPRSPLAASGTLR